MARFRSTSTVLGYRPGEEFDADPDDVEVAAYLAGGHLVRVGDVTPETDEADLSTGIETAKVADAGPVDLDSAKVADLRAWLDDRGLDSTGKRADLVARVEEALGKAGEAG
jgi:hypothetical protein